MTDFIRAWRYQAGQAASKAFVPMSFEFGEASDLVAQEILELFNLEEAMEVRLISGTSALVTTFLRSAMMTQ